MYFHVVHGKNIVLSSDNSQAKRVCGFCQGLTFSNNPLTQFQRITFVISNEFMQNANLSNKQFSLFKKSKKANWNGGLRIGLTTKNPITLTTSDLPEFSHPTLLNTDCFWITLIKSSYLRNGNKISIVLDKDNSLQLFVNYVLKATLFGNGVINSSVSTKLWLILDLYGTTNFVQFLPSDDTPYEIKARGLDAVNNFHSACLTGGSKSIYKTKLIIVGQEGVGKSSLRNCLVNIKERKKAQVGKLDMSASLRVSIDNLSNLWRLKNLHRSDLNELQSPEVLKRHSSHNNLSHSYNHNTSSTLTKSFSNSNGSLNRILNNSNSNFSTSNNQNNNNNNTRLIKRRSSSTSYLNEEDDYDDENDFDELKKFQRQLSLFGSFENKNVKTPKKSRENDANNERRDVNVEVEDELNENSNSSDECIDEYSDSSDSDDNYELYSIDEYDESLQSLDCDPSTLN